MKRIAGALFATLVPAMAAPAFAGPPFLTDDPQPVDYQHYELYVFTQSDNDVTGASRSTSGPALEFNAGILPNAQLHIVI